MATLRRVSRTDYVQVSDEDLARATFTPEGFMKVDGWFMRSGPQTYGHGDKAQVEYRDPAKLFTPEILRRHELVPIVDDHPDEKVTPGNAMKHVRGATGQDVRRDGDRGRASFMIYDGELIAKMRSKQKVELSVGYECDWDPTPLVVDGVRCDGQQLNWTPNHIAVVERGRAGNALVRVDRTDHLDMASEKDEKVGSMTPEEIKALQDQLAAALAKITDLEAKLAEKDKPPEGDGAQPTAAEVAAVKAAPEEAAKKLDWQRRRADSAERDLVAAQRQLGALKDEVAVLKKRADGASSATREQVKARNALDRVASVVCPELYEQPVDQDGRRLDSAECKADSMGDREVMVAVVERVDGIKVPAERSMDYVRGSFEASAARVRRSNGDYERLDAITQPREGDYGRSSYDYSYDRRGDARSRDDRARQDLEEAIRTNGAAAYDHYSNNRGLTIYGQKKD